MFNKTNKQDPKCHHLWKRAGLWDGKDEKGQKTGGPVLVCSSCQEKKFVKWGEEEK